MKNGAVVWFAWVNYDGVKKLLEVRISEASTRPVAAQLSRTVDLPLILVPQRLGRLHRRNRRGISNPRHSFLEFLLYHAWNERPGNQFLDPGVVRIFGLVRKGRLTSYQCLVYKTLFLLSPRPHYKERKSLGNRWDCV